MKLGDRWLPLLGGPYRWYCSENSYTARFYPNKRDALVRTQTFRYYSASWTEYECNLGWRTSNSGQSSSGWWLACLLVPHCIQRYAASFLLPIEICTLRTDQCLSKRSGPVHFSIRRKSSAYTWLFDWVIVQLQRKGRFLERLMCAVSFDFGYITK